MTEESFFFYLSRSERCRNFRCSSLLSRTRLTQVCDYIHKLVLLEIRELIYIYLNGIRRPTSESLERFEPMLLVVHGDRRYKFALEYLVRSCASLFIIIITRRTRRPSQRKFQTKLLTNMDVPTKII